MLPSLEEVSTSPSSHIQPASCLYAISLPPWSTWAWAIEQDTPGGSRGTLQVIPGRPLRLFQTWEMNGPIYKEKKKNSGMKLWNTLKTFENQQSCIQKSLY